MAAGLAVGEAVECDGCLAGRVAALEAVGALLLIPSCQHVP